MTENLQTDARFNKGEKLIVVLSDTPSTGYRWEVSSLPEGVVLKEATRPYRETRDVKAGPRYGSPSVVCFHLVAESDVRGHAVFAKTRKWLGEQEGDEKADIKFY